VNGAIGVVMAPRGRLVRALRFTIANGKITEIEVIGNPARLGDLDVSGVLTSADEVDQLSPAQEENGAT
jgi:hypothetical protein